MERPDLDTLACVNAANVVDVLPVLKDGASTVVFPSPIEGSGTTRV